MNDNFTKTKLIFFIIALFLSSCASVKDFKSNDNQVVETIEQYLKNEKYFNEDIFLNEDTKDSINFCPTLSAPYWVIPSEGLVSDIHIQKSNNNVSIAIFNQKIYLAFRTGPTHFASRKTGVYVISSEDGKHWQKELSLFFGKDVREPFLIPINDELHFYFFTAGVKMTAFEPQNISHYILNEDENWLEFDNVLSKGEVHWSMKKRNGRIYMTSYEGAHYQLKGPSNVSLYLKQTTNGTDFFPQEDSARVYLGGVSECAFEFDYEGNIWAVTRLEDGDETGFGSHVVFADKDNLFQWEFPDTADVRCFMSPKMFNHNDKLYLVARKQLGKKPFGKTNRNKSLKKQRIRNWAGYSLSPKTTALYKINKTEKKVEWLMDLPGVGDTAFPSIQRLDEHKFLIANYSSPIHRRKKRSWLSGQLGKTGIYLQVIEFGPCNKEK